MLVHFELLSGFADGGFVSFYQNAEHQPPHQTHNNDHQQYDRIPDILRVVHEIEPLHHEAQDQDPDIDVVFGVEDEQPGQEMHYMQKGVDFEGVLDVVLVRAGLVLIGFPFESELTAIYYVFLVVVVVDGEGFGDGVVGQVRE